MAPASSDSARRAATSTCSTQQEEVARSVVSQRAQGNRALIGLMIESYLEEGSQPVPANLDQLKYGVSITDACVSWDTTERMLRHAHAAL